MIPLPKIETICDLVYPLQYKGGVYMYKNANLSEPGYNIGIQASASDP